MKNQRPCFPSHTPILPSLFLLLSCSLCQIFSPSPGLCRRGQKESMKRKKEQEREGRENGQEGRVIEMRDLGAGGTKQTDSIGWRSKSIEQSRRGGGQPGQGERRGGTSTGARAPITTLASGVQWGIKWASPGQHQRKR